MIPTDNKEVFGKTWEEKKNCIENGENHAQELCGHTKDLSAFTRCKFRKGTCQMC